METFFFNFLGGSVILWNLLKADSYGFLMCSAYSAFQLFLTLMWNQFSILRNNAHTWILIMYSVIKMSVSDARALELSYQKWYSGVFAEKFPSLIKLRKAVFVLDLLDVDACFGNRSTLHFVFQPGFAASWCTMQAWKKLTLQLSWTLSIWLLRSLERSKVSHLSTLRD